MKKFQILVISVLMCTMPVSGSWAAFPDMPPVTMGELQSSAQNAWGGASDILSPAFDLHFFDGGAPAIGAGLAELLFSPTGSDNQSLSDEELQSIVTGDGVLIPGSSERFWTRGKIWTSVSLMVITGLIIGLVAMFSGSGSGSGDSSGSGSGSGGNSGQGDTPPNGDPSNPDGLPEGDGGNPPVVPGGGGSGSGSGGPFVPPSNIPHNPEPSTFLLAGLGLLIPLFRKRGQ